MPVLADYAALDLLNVPVSGMPHGDTIGGCCLASNMLNLP